MGVEYLLDTIGESALQNPNNKGKAIELRSYYRRHGYGAIMIYAVVENHDEEHQSKVIETTGSID
ncbi:hypothetical protein KI387_026233, partial [Taxus chinensis]